MKTIVKKSGQKFNITDTLYETIMKKGLMEDDLKANPQSQNTNNNLKQANQSIGDNGNANNTKKENNKNVQNPAEEKLNSMQEKRISKYNENDQRMIRYVYRYIYNKTGGFPSSGFQYCVELALDMNDMLPPNADSFKNEEYIREINHIINMHLRCQENPLFSSIYNYMYGILKRENRLNKFGKDEFGINGALSVYVENYMINSDLKLDGNVLTPEIKSDIDDLLKKELRTTLDEKEVSSLKKIIIECIPDIVKNLKNGLSTYQEEARSEILKILSNQYGDKKAKEIGYDVNLVKTIIDGIVPPEKWSEIADYIVQSLIADKDKLTRYELSSSSGKTNIKIKSQYTFMTLLDFIYGNDAAKKNYLSDDDMYFKLEKVIDFAVSNYFYNYISNILLSNEFVNNTIKKTDHIPDDWIKVFLKNLDRKIYLIIMNKSSSSENSIPLKDDMSNEQISEMWDEISEEILKEVSINPLDDVILNSFKRIIRSMNSDSKDKELINYPNGQNKDQDKEPSIINLKKEFFKIYNNYRKKLYDRTVDYIERISFDKKFVDGIKNRFQNIDTNDINNFEGVIKQCRILFDIQSKISNKNDDTESDSSAEEIKNGVSESVKEEDYLLEESNENNSSKTDMLIVSTMTRMMNVLFKYTDYLTKMIKDKDDLKSWVRLETYKKYDQLFNYSNVQNTYFYLTLLEKSIPLVKLTLNVNDEKDPNGDDSELETFRMHMGRLPNSSDYTLFEDTIQQLSEMTDVMNKIQKQFEKILDENNYVKWVEYIMTQEKEISWKILNNILGSNLLTENSADFINRCLAYGALTRYVKSGAANQLCKDIVGNGDGISDKDLAKLFYKFVIVDPNISSQTFITLLMSEKSLNNNISFNRTYLPNKFYTAQPVVLTSTGTKDFIGCITFVKYDFLNKMFKATGKFANSIKSLLRSNSNSRV